MSEQRAVDQVKMLRLLGKFWTAANILSLTRLILVIPITYLILTDGSLTLLFGLILVAIVTDWFDGHLARWSHTVSDWGKVLDPLADKMAAVLVTLALVVRGSLPVWFVVFIIIRDLLIVLGGIYLARRTGKVVMSIWLGKVAITFVALTVLAALLRADQPILEIFVWASIFFLTVSFLLYIGRFVRMLRPDSDALEPEHDLDPPHSLSSN